MIIISRNWTNDASLIEEAFARVKKNRHDCWIILYPEGTRRTPEKLLEAQAFAGKRGKEELKHLLIPRTKGFMSTIKGLRGSHIKYIYDLTFLYTSPSPDTYRVPSVVEQLSCTNLAKAGYGFRIHVRRLAIDDLPEDEAGLREWCEEAWRRKDMLLDSMMGQKGENGHGKEH